jgi:hypothetical protein
MSTTRRRLTIEVQLVIPKFHGAKLMDIPDDHLGEILVCVDPKPIPFRHVGPSS